MAARCRPGRVAGVDRQVGRNNMTVMMQMAPLAGRKVEAMTVNSVRFTDELEARLVASARRLGMRKSDVIRMALGEFLARDEAMARAQAQAEIARGLDCAPMGEAVAVGA